MISRHQCRLKGITTLGPMCDSVSTAAGGFILGAFSSIGLASQPINFYFKQTSLIF